MNTPPPISSRATRFVGRSLELARLRELFAQGARLVTVAGSGGIGKTRLAIALAGQVRDDFPGGIWFCDLTGAQGLEDLCRALARSLELPGATSSAPAILEQVGAALDARPPTLVILDNFEQLVEHAQATFGKLFQAAPSASFLVTSRIRLQLEAETLFPLPPMSVPAPDADLELLADVESIQLFVARARQVWPDFSLDPDNAPAVAEIVRRLDGLPLAIELIASRLGILSPAQLLSRLDRRFALLTGGLRDGAARHSSLRAALDGSWYHLRPWEQAALAQCGVFRGGFTLEAAEAVVDLSGFPEAPPVLDVIQSLMDHSLLSAAPAGPLSERRLTMLESIRDYALERLSGSGHRLDALARHAAWYGELALTWHEAPREDAALIPRMLAEEANLLEVIGRANELQAAGREGLSCACKALIACGILLLHRFPVTLFLQGAAELRAMAETTPVDARLLLAVRLGSAGVWDLFATGSDTLSELEAIAIEARRLNARRLEARAWLALATRCLPQGRWEKAEHATRAALEGFQASGDRYFEVLAIATLSRLLHAAGRWEEASTWIDRLRERGLETGNPRLTAPTSYYLACYHRATGELERAAALFHEALASCRQIRDLNEGHLISDYAGCRALTGHPDDAEAHYRAALAIARRDGTRNLETIIHYNLGLLLVERERWIEARACLERALSLARAGDNPLSTPVSLGSLSLLEAATDNLPEAGRRLVQAEECMPASEDPGPDGFLALVRIRLELGRARRAALAGDAETARAALSGAEARWSAFRASHGRALGSPPPRRDSTLITELLLAERIVAQALEAARAALALAGKPEGGSRRPDKGGATAVFEEGPAGAVPARELRVGPQGLWFEAAGAARVSLDRRRKLARLLSVLVHHRLTAPGIPQSRARLFAEVWPGEAARPDAASNRLYVAVSTLRSLGLRDMLRSDETGYWLNDGIEVKIDGEKAAR